MTRISCLVGSAAMLALGILWIPRQASAAAPQLFKTCAGVVPVSNQGPLLFDSTCSSGFLLPSPRGSLTVNSAFFVIDDDLCNSVQELERAALGSFGSAIERSKRRTALQQHLGDLIARRQTDSSAVAALQPVLSAIRSKLGADQAAIGPKESTFASQCQSDPTRSFVCSSLSSELQNLRAEITDFTSKEAQLQSLIEAKLGAVTAAQTQETALKASIDALSPTAAPNELQTVAQAHLVELASHPGAVVGVTLETSLGNDLKRLREQNSGTSVNLEQIRFVSGSLFAAGIDKNGVPESTGAATVVIPGEPIQGGGTLFINISGVQLKLDPVSACRAFNYKRPNPANLSGISSQLAAAVVAKAYLRYRALLGVSVTVTLDYKKFYDFLVQNRTTNGFFKTSTVKSITETLSGQNSLSVSIVDENNILSSDAKAAIQSAMRDRVIQRALDYLNAKYVGIDASAQPAAPTAGAPALSTALQKCANVWCQAGAVVVNIADSIFGGSESTQSLVQRLSINNSETYSDQESFEFVTDLTFVPR